jgi:valyl-tRNA synthetase
MNSGKMAIRDKFIISRLTACCETVNDSFANYKFGDAQQAAYAFWMNDVCDVYLELIKPVIKDEAEENKDNRWAAQAALWLAIEAGLRILHPMMPFVTEELWQRLPGRGSLGDSEPESIMLAEFPTCNEAYKNVQCEESMEATMKIIRACRSLRQQYNIANKTLTHFFVKIETGLPEDAAKSQTDDIKTLGKAETVEINLDEDAIPKSVGIVVVDESTTVLMDIKGLVDYAAEIKKLDKQLSKTAGPMKQLETKMAAPGYDNNVSDDVKATNTERLEGLKKKMADIEEALANMKNLAELEKTS